MNESMNPLPQWLSGKEPACNAEKWIRSLGQEDPLEEGMATHSRKKLKKFSQYQGDGSKPRESGHVTWIVFYIVSPGELALEEFNWTGSPLDAKMFMV